ncbi:MAG: hypothetical protein VX278_09580, partial [Myxococcota bacterium]|nr:hypothetical protein [Myxococcota bacterium]
MFSTFLLSFTLLNSAEALPFGNDEAKKKKAEEIAAEEKAEEAAKNAKAARVVVLKWQNTTTDHNDATLKLNVQSAISRTNVTFLPAIDLYQGGRELKDRTIPPSDQPAKVPSSVVGKIQSLVQDTASIRYDQLDSNQWAEKARTLRELAEEIWFVDRIELREPLFLLYTEIGRSADNVSEFQMGAPFYEYIGATQLNYYQYLAATLAEQEPALMEKLDDPDTVAQVEFYLEQIRQGVFPTMRIDFQMEDVFKKEKFDKQYEILFNGLPVQVDELGQKEILLGRTDIYLKDKKGGHGLTDRLEAIKTDEKSYSVLDDARKRMTIDFVKQLFLFENECKPKVDNDILTYLSIYAKMHPQVQEEIYIAVPKNGNPNKVWVWRYDVETTSLNKVASGNDNFPVHFVGLLNTGFTYTGATAGLAEIEPSDLVGLSPEDFLELDTVPGAVP